MAADNRHTSSSADSRLTSAVIGRLTEDIVAGHLEPRTRLPTEKALMETFGVSRTVVREAIAALRADGLVETRRGAGAFVASDPRKRPFRIDPDELRSMRQLLDVMELRICVEVEAAGLAAQRRTSADVAKLKRLCRVFAEAVAAGDEAIDDDFAFHAAIGAATGNPFFTSFLEFLGRMIIPQRRMKMREDGEDGALESYLATLLDEHNAIVDAISAGDVGVARRAMHNHLKRGRDRVRRASEQGEAEGKRQRGGRR